ncbi:MAG: hypothetical protein KAT77_04745 [Nanoarchaeota archaeon]|nr:hypothetical protein [Nanoarchaeota archaeon]
MALDDGIVWPEYDGFYKVIQVRVKGREYLRIAADSAMFHCELLKSFLDKIGVDYRTREFGGGKRKGPEVHGDGYELFGAGLVKSLAEEKEATFGERSSDYDCGIDISHIKKIKDSDTSRKIRVAFGRLR